MSKSLPENDTDVPENAAWVKVGKYRIYHDERGFWIRIGGGEGGTFSETELEKVIDKFYADNF